MHCTKSKALCFSPEMHWEDLSATVLQNCGSSTLIFPVLGPSLTDSDVLQKAGVALFTLSKFQYKSAINLAHRSNESFFYIIWKISLKIKFCCLYSSQKIPSMLVQDGYRSTGLAPGLISFLSVSLKFCLRSGFN